MSTDDLDDRARLLARRERDGVATDVGFWDPTNERASSHINESWSVGYNGSFCHVKDGIVVEEHGPTKTDGEAYWEQEHACRRIQKMNLSPINLSDVIIWKPSPEFLARQKERKMREAAMGEAPDPPRGLGEVWRELVKRHGATGAVAEMRRATEEFARALKGEG